MTGPTVPTFTPIFDWYAATINSGVDTLRDVLSRDLRGAATFEDGPRNGYHNREVIRDRDGRLLAVMLHGGNGDIPHAFATSDASPAFATLVREVWPDRHKVSRFDACLDFDGPTAWSELLDMCKVLVSGERVDGDLRKRASKIRTNYMGDWLHGEHGRTFGMGSYKSAVYCRLYEKGIQVREDDAKRGIVRTDYEFSPDAVRLEVQVRPAGDSKRLAAKSTPAEAFGYADWTRELLRRVDGSKVERVHIKERRDSDHERAMQTVAHQYRNHLLQELMIHGSWAAVGESIGRRIESAGADVNDENTPF